ncbi:MAG: arylesterase [Gammaproteobacteria bacterium]|nr:arylesterase [Gammaproteobacteria bacterium]
MLSPLRAWKLILSSMVRRPAGPVTDLLMPSARMTKSSRTLLSLIPLLVTLLWSLAGRAAEPVILIVGDSLSAGYGLAANETWVKQLEDRLAAQGYPHKVVNASISGETTSGGRTRLPALLTRHTPAVVLLELGGNDGLRGISIDEMRANFARMLEAAQGANASAMLVAIELPPNYGPAFLEKFRTTYRELAAEYAVPLTPFLLEGVALEPELMQDDGIHPKAAAAPRMLENVWPTLLPLLGKTGARTQ